MAEDEVIELNVHGKNVPWAWGRYINNACTNLFSVSAKWTKNTFRILLLNIRRLSLTEKLSSKISWQNININLKLFELSVEKLSLGQIHKQYQSVLNVRLVGRKYVSNNRVSFILGDLSFQKYKPLHTIYFWLIHRWFFCYNIKGQKYKLFLN